MSNLGRDHAGGWPWAQPPVKAVAWNVPGTFPPVKAVAWNVCRDGFPQ